MTINRTVSRRIAELLMFIITLVALSSTHRADTGTCSGQLVTLPFNDVSPNFFFCQIAEAYFSGLTNGTSANTFSPHDTVDRQQMAAFITRTMDQSLRRGSRRAALNQWWTSSSHFDIGLGVTTVGLYPGYVVSDGTDLWVTNTGGTVSRVRASDGRLIETWTGTTQGIDLLAAMGRIFITGGSGLEGPGKLYMINPGQPVGAAVTVADSLGPVPRGLTFDGSRIWSANSGSGSPGTGSISIITPGPTTPWAVQTIASGSYSPIDILYDGVSFWVAEYNFDIQAGRLLRLDQNGSTVLTIDLAGAPEALTFDGTNLWVGINDQPDGQDSVVVVRASTGGVLATLTGNGLGAPISIAFDGERILVANNLGSSVSLWKAADLAPLGAFSTGQGSNPSGACSDGVNFWIVNNGQNQLLRF